MQTYNKELKHSFHNYVEWNCWCEKKKLPPPPKAPPPPPHLPLPPTPPRTHLQLEGVQRLHLPSARCPRAGSHEADDHRTRAPAERGCSLDRIGVCCISSRKWKFIFNLMEFIPYSWHATWLRKGRSGTRSISLYFEYIISKAYQWELPPSFRWICGSPPFFQPTSTCGTSLGRARTVAMRFLTSTIFSHSLAYLALLSAHKDTMTSISSTVLINGRWGRSSIRKKKINFMHRNAILF